MMIDKLASKVNKRNRKSSSGTRPTKRRTRQDIARLCREIYEICELNQPLTVRNLYYRMVTRGLINKTQAEYKNVTVRLAGDMREDGSLPWHWIVDETRLMRKPRSYASLSDMLERSQELYRRDLWASQDVYLEVWCESDSVAGVIYDATAKWDVPLMASRGFSSKAFCWNAAQSIEYENKPAVIIYVGDYDPAGLFIDRDIEAKLRRYTPDSDITFKRIAVTPEQIEAYDLPSRPPKKGDLRAKSFEGECVEVEALETSVLRGLVQDEIISHINPEKYEKMLAVETAEKDTLHSLISSMG